MQTIVSITSQGQVTIPKEMRDAFRITGSVKALARRVGKQIIIEPQTDFFDLAGSLSGSTKLSDEELRQAREQFSKQWPRK
ncbi:MAG: hypothetical protein UX37_C0018G0011 [Microgenomates group bacterium GW2011_GWA2_46_16]|nr:MAG: hypothetical protein UX37_C0018G0011 [Microgenomates group bacterium GW2011_GWA2_46_16]